MTRLTIEAVADIRARHAAGASVAECARHAGISWSHAKRVVVGENWRGHRKPNPRAIDTARRDRIRSLLADGEKMVWIAYEVGVSLSTVRKNSKTGGM